MSATFRLSGGESKRVASVIRHDGLDDGLVTYSHPYDHYQYEVNYLTNEEFGRSLNTNPTAGSITSTTIHDGTDTVAWTAAAVTGGGFDFASTAQVYAGTKSIDASVSANNDIAGFTAPAPINPTSFQEFRMFMYITAWSQQGTKNVTLQFFSGGAAVSVELNMSAYIDVSLFNVWQRVDIPIGDFQILAANIDELRIKTVDSGRGNPPDYYLDNLQLISSVSSTGTNEYIWAPAYGDDYYLKTIRFTALTSGKTNLDSSEFFGISALTTGLELVYRNDKQVFVALDARDLFSMLSWGDVHPVVEGSTNNVTLIVDFNIPEDQFRLSGSNGDYLAVRVRDDLTGITQFNCSAVLAKRVQR